MSRLLLIQNVETAEDIAEALGPKDNWQLNRAAIFPLNGSRAIVVTEEEPFSLEVIPYMVKYVLEQPSDVLDEKIIAHVLNATMGEYVEHLRHRGVERAGGFLTVRFSNQGDNVHSITFNPVKQLQNPEDMGDYNPLMQQSDDFSKYLGDVFEAQHSYKFTFSLPMTREDMIYLLNDLFLTAKMNWPNIN
jgi:hypothetical protein